MHSSWKSSEGSTASFARTFLTLSLLSCSFFWVNELLYRSAMATHAAALALEGCCCIFGRRDLVAHEAGS